uniref:Uncharacterized protein n=1 Tax=Arundo donax TaxID=35708 RepID=A0A0A9HSS7_ARUDO
MPDLLSLEYLKCYILRLQDTGQCGRDTMEVVLIYCFPLHIHLSQHCLGFCVRDLL